MTGISMGCMRLAGADESAVTEIIETATECGITHFDNADIYSAGESEIRT